VPRRLEQAEWMSLSFMGWPSRSLSTCDTVEMIGVARGLIRGTGWGGTVVKKVVGSDNPLSSTLSRGFESAPLSSIRSLSGLQQKVLQMSTGCYTDRSSCKTGH